MDLPVAETKTPRKSVPREARATEADRRWSSFQIWWRCAALYGAMIAYSYAVLPLWGLVVANVLLWFRAAGEVHDLGHAFSAKRAGWSARLFPMARPFLGGVRVFSYVHRRHHSHLGTDRDPWVKYYSGHPLKAFLWSGIEPERNLIHYVQRKGIDLALVGNLLFNLSFFVVSVALFKWAYLTHFAVQWLTHQCSSFAFNFYPHRDGFSSNAPIGTFRKDHELRQVIPLLRLVWGSFLTDALIFHNRHHVMTQGHVGGLKYHFLTDDGGVNGAFTRFTKEWPIARIQRLEAVAGEGGDQRSDELFSA